MKPLRQELDFALLNHLVAPGVFTRIDPTLEAQLTVMPEVAERVAGCERFVWHLGQDNGIGAIGLSGVARTKQKYLRAALCEYTSMEDAATLDFEGKSMRPLAISALPNPHLHVVRLLRHANVHIAASQLSSAKRDAIWPGPDGPVEFEHSHYVVANLTRTICATRDAERYSREDLVKMTDWLEIEQQEWGIGNVILKAAEAYALALAELADVISESATHLQDGFK